MHTPAENSGTTRGWWADHPWRLIQTNLREIDMADIDAGEYVRQLKSFDATIAMINVGGIIASYPTKLEDHFQSPSASLSSLSGHKERPRTVLIFSKKQDPDTVVIDPWVGTGSRDRGLGRVRETQLVP